MSPIMQAFKQLPALFVKAMGRYSLAGRSMSLGGGFESLQPHAVWLHVCS